MKILGMAQFERIVYRNIMLEGVKAFIKATTDLNESNSMFNLMTKLTETHFNDKFMNNKLTVDQLSEQFSNSAYHFQKLSNIAEGIAIAKSRLMLESKVEFSEEMTDLTDEEQAVVDAVTSDVPEELADAVAERVAAALSADNTRAQTIQASVDVMTKQGDSPEVIEKIIQEASQYPSSLLNSIVSFQSRSYMKISFNEGCQDLDSSIKLNAQNIRNEALLVYTMHECFNVGLKAYTLPELTKLSTEYFRA